MKNKKVSYILIPAVLLVWGLIIYQVYQRWFAEEQFIFTEQIAPPPPPKKTKQKENTSLIADYRDPFLGKNYAPRPNIKKTKVKPPPKKEVEKPPTPWPEIAFQGMIKNQNSGTLLGLVKINGKSSICKEEQVISEVTIHKITTDSILLSFGKEKRSFIKNDMVAGK